MSDLDKKLENVLRPYFAMGGIANSSALPKCVDEIRQAFIDDGWRPKAKVDAKIQRGANDSFFFSGDMNALREANNLMTGQEWYNRLSAELSSRKGKHMYPDIIFSGSDVDDMAMKAAGIE